MKDLCDVTLQSHTSIAGSEVCSGSVASALQTSAAYNVIMKMFDFTLLLSPSYLVLCFGGVLPFLGKLIIPYRVST